MGFQPSFQTNGTRKIWSRNLQEDFKRIETKGFWRRCNAPAKSLVAMNGWIANHPCIPAILKTRVLTHTQVTPTIDVVCVCVLLPFELLFNNRKWNTNDSTWQWLSCSMISAIITTDLASIPSFFCNIQWIPRHNWFGINGYYIMPYHITLYHITSFHTTS